MGIEALDSLLTRFIKTKIADKDGDGQLSKSEASLFTYSTAGKDLADKLIFKVDDEYDAIDWIKVNQSLETHDFSAEATNLDMAASQIMMGIDTDGDGDILDELEKFDTDKDGVLSDDELKKASESNVNIKNMVEIFYDDIKSDKSKINNIFSFENIQRYTELVNINKDIANGNEYTVLNNEAKAFGRLITSSESTISGYTVSKDKLLEILQKYISTGSVSAGEETKIITELKERKTKSVELESTVSGCTVTAEYEVLPTGEKLQQIHLVSTINGHEYYIPAVTGLDPEEIVRVSFLGDTTFAVQTSDGKVRIFQADTREEVGGVPVRTYKSDFETFDTLDEYKADRIAKVTDALTAMGLVLGTGDDAVTWYNTTGYLLISCKDDAGNEYDVTWENGIITEIKPKVVLT